jgi:uncharacterized protein (DUF2235 family)
LAFVFGVTGELHMGRHLISLIDGTMVSASQAAGYSSYSNVYELGYLLQLDSTAEDNRPQVVFYSSGISSQPGTRDAIGLITGNPIYSQILDQYTNICANYDFKEADAAKQDKIYIFGFSRGAMAARALAGLICSYGLLKPDDIRAAPAVVAAWQVRLPAPGDIELHEAGVEFVGVFDSVMGGVESWPMFNPIKFPDGLVPSGCKHAIQILAIDEDRRFFKPKIWTGRKECPMGEGQCGYRQIWMPGVHSDVGGTGNSVWGRAAMLTMMHYIEHWTSLELDNDWRRRMERDLRKSLKENRIFIERHRPLRPFRMSRIPNSESDSAECYHPIIDLVRSWSVDGKEGYDWKGKEFDARFNGLQSREVEPDLYDYFERILK